MSSRSDAERTKGNVRKMKGNVIEALRNHQRTDISG
jgi:hypothetical protein